MEYEWCSTLLHGINGLIRNANMYFLRNFRIQLNTIFPSAKWMWSCKQILKKQELISTNMTLLVKEIKITLYIFINHYHHHSP